MKKQKPVPQIRTFDTGATRDTDDNKHHFGGYLSPLAMERFAEYMTQHRVQPDGNLRAPDNWKKGIDLESYFDSAFRHFHDWWKEVEGNESREGLEDALCGLLFNTFGYLHETLKSRGYLAKETK